MRAALRVAVGLLLAHSARAEAVLPSSADEVIDRVQMLFWAPEFGGPERPHMLSVRELSFWADVEATGEEGKASGAARYRSAAAERLMIEDLWAARDARELRDAAELDALSKGLYAELVRRTGGGEKLDALRELHGVSVAEVMLRMRERARALRHAESHYTRVRSLSEADLRGSWDAQKHPFVGQDYGEARSAFSVWYRVDVLRGLELEQLRASRKLVRIRELQ